MATVAGKGRWDWALYPKLSDAMKAAAELHDVPIVWGGDWPRFRDGPHFELDRKEYRF
jgi:peptidoglycan L-alanyl-D-glutamate endopeptidase CwlK